MASVSVLQRVAGMVSSALWEGVLNRLELREVNLIAFIFCVKELKYKTLEVAEMVRAVDSLFSKGLR